MKIFLCESVHEEVYQLLNKKYEVIDNYDYIHLCEVVISRNLTIDSSFIDRCDSLKLVIVHGTGYDDVDVKYLKSKQILLCNIPYQNALSVSELIVTMMLELSRRTILLNTKYKSGDISTIAPKEYIGSEISYKTFGLIGVGDIALKTAKILKDGFHMKIIGYSPSLTEIKAYEYGIEYCKTMNDVFKDSDFVSINSSLNSSSYHMITQKQLSLMKPTAFLINTARGAIINENDLETALKERWIAGAGLDVLENEPVSYTHPLLQFDNVVYTPHIGASTNEALKRVGMKVYDIINKYSHGELCEHFLI